MAKRSSNFALGAVIAAGVGYVIGVLTAPKSGRETREDIQRATLKAKTDAEKNLKELYGEIDSKIDQGRHQVKTASEKVKTELTHAIETAQSAKDKARQALSSLHEGDTDNKELQKAVKDVRKALDHLKNYVNDNAAKKK